MLDESNIIAHKYVNILPGYGLISCINTPTRVTDTTRTCTDHIFVRHRKTYNVRSANVKTEITDHYSVSLDIAFFVSGNCSSPKDFKQFVDKEKFKSVMKDQNWESVLNWKDVDVCVNAFHNIVHSVIGSSTKFVKQRNRILP